MVQRSSLVLPCVVLCRTAFCRLSDDGQRRIAQRIDIDGAAYRLHGQKLAGMASNRESNNVGETASAAAELWQSVQFWNGAGDKRAMELCCNRSHSSKFEMMVAFVRLSPATIPSSAADTALTSFEVKPKIIRLGWFDRLFYMCAIAHLVDVGSNRKQIKCFFQQE